MGTTQQQFHIRRDLVLVFLSTLHLWGRRKRKASTAKAPGLPRAGPPALLLARAARSRSHFGKGRMHSLASGCGHCPVAPVWTKLATDPNLARWTARPLLLHTTLYNYLFCYSQGCHFDCKFVICISSLPQSRHSVFWLGEHQNHIQKQ